MTKVLFVFLLSLIGASCSRLNVKNAIEVDRNDPAFISKIKNKTPSEVEKILGEAVFRGHPTRGYDQDLQEYKLVYVEKGQAPIYEWQLRLRVSNNSNTNADTGVKCIAVNFSAENGFKFENGGAAIDWNYDCIRYKDIKGDLPK